MADYVPRIVTESDIRNFFSPPLDYDDVSRAEILIKIEAVEDFVTAVYFNGSTPSAAKARIPVLLLIAAKIIHTPSLSRKYMTLSAETLGDYSYELAQPISSGTDVQSNPYVIAKTWERMALDMLSARAIGRWAIYKAND